MGGFECCPRERYLEKVKERADPDIGCRQLGGERCVSPLAVKTID